MEDRIPKEYAVTAQASKPKKKKARKLKLPFMTFGCTGLVFAFIVAWTVAYVIWIPQTHRTVTATVTKAWVTCKESSEHIDCKNLIGTTAGVFQDTDSLMYWKFNSSDYFSTMQVGKTYTFSVVGWRIPFPSEYPNIVSCEDC